VLVDEGHELREENAYDPNHGTAEIELTRTRLEEFVTEFLGHLSKKDASNSSLQVFCRVDMSIIVKHGTVSFFVNEVERGIATSLWGKGNDTAPGQVGSDMAWPLACWIKREKARISG
jgi:hypothetical protein